jgi:nucleotide-binding universal stress UspA family protein
VYVLSPDQLNLSVEFSPPLIAHYLPAAEKALKNALKRAEIPGMLPPKVLVQKMASLSQAISTLNNHAIITGADLIAVGTHAKKGLARFFLGSFTEVLLLGSTVPVLTINPKTKLPARDNHILFATDASPASQEAFKRLINLAKDLKAGITLYHYVKNPIEPIIQSGAFLLGGGWIPVSTYVRDESAQLERELEKMAERARKAGIQTEVLMDSGLEGVTEGVLENAKKKKATLIALAAQSGPVAATLMGSIARQVVRTAECPVWVIRKKEETAKKPRGRKRSYNVTLF